MPEGKIEKLMDKGFGFIREDGNDKDIFFHCTSLQNAEFSALEEGDRVEFGIGQGPKGKRAENVTLLQ